ncbi:acetyltransferase-like isoleucine patch superfamily enzyme [Pseudomonas hunanensis]|uniref:Acetyltransferase-like isoleucine patch superfamily enzyme n=1 Tax=Pseudomonas hunanensis TaxID=1247546 RepID=A0ACC6K8E7_9PSED|nr:CatB-related O-acetyltransferase [Pseudomonas hunanensis]MDR6714699.1 acetyltransferase-like isoleucine patch superfamily enzyme [Pseudomonas hunanensis]
MRAPFSSLKEKFKSASVYFTNSGKDRFSDSDNISFLKACQIEPFCGFLGGDTLYSMGSFSYSWSQLPSNTQVGRYCSIAKGVKILGTRHPMEWLSTSSFTYDSAFPIFKDLNSLEGDRFKVSQKPTSDSTIMIGHDVWIGANVVLKPGITIGTGSVIAASSLVVKDVAPYSVVGGNPGKLIKSRFDSETVNRLLKSEWWDYKFTDFADLNFKDPQEFCEQLDAMVKQGHIEKFNPGFVNLHEIAIK